MKSTSTKPGSSWFLLVFLGAGVLVVMACLAVLVVLLGWGGWIASSRWPAVVNESLPRQTTETDLAPTPAQVVLPTEAAAVQPQTPQTALLIEARGFVQTRDGDGEWTGIHEDAPVQVGQHLRTGNFSSATLRFFDGSEAKLGPSTELALDRLDANPDGTQTISLTQSVGRGDYQVAASDFQVNTPSGAGKTGRALFHVYVSPSKFTRFEVSDGALEVTGFDTTMTVLAGQSTTTDIGLPPSGPYFHIQGEGRVDRVGASWRIAGSIYQTNANTLTTGNPQAGDWVSFRALVLIDGTRIVQQITLLEREQKNQFELRGEVQSIGPSQWKIAGRDLQVNENILLDPNIQVGDHVKVYGYIQAGAMLAATRIRQTVDSSGSSFEVIGVIQAISGSAWSISDALFTVNADTQIEPGLAAGTVVGVQGQILTDGARLAQTIRPAPYEDSEFSWIGNVESTTPWRVSGIQFETDSRSVIGSQVAPGDQVRVSGRLLENGRWLARNILRLEEATQSDFNFWAAVNQTDPWMVGGVPLAAEENITLQGKVNVSRLVHVTGVVLPDGTLAAQAIVGQDQRQGCLSLTSIVREIDSNKIILFDWQVIRIRGGVTLQGEVKTASIVQASGCVGEDGNFLISSVVVLAQMEALPVVK